MFNLVCFNLLGCHFWDLTVDAADSHENNALFLQEKQCPWQQVPRAEGTCKRQVGSPQPPLSPLPSCLQRQEGCYSD